MTDYKLKGTPEEISGIIYQEDGKTLNTGIQVIGPRVLDDVAYVNIRTDAALVVPHGVSETGPELSDAIVGIWYDLPTPSGNTANWVPYGQTRGAD